MEFVIQLFFVIALVLLNGFFVASEFALVSIRKTRIEEMSKKKNRAAKLVKKALKDLDTYISSTQLGITLASLALGWIGEPALAHFFEPLFSSFSKDAQFYSAHGLAVGIAFSIITFMHIVLGELAPKTLALQKPEQVSLFFIIPLMVFTTVFKPFIWILNGAGNMVLKLFGLSTSGSHHQLYSEAEIKMILHESAEGGLLEDDEVEMAHSVLKFADIPVKKIMTPKKDVIAFKQSALLKDILPQIESNIHSRFPVYEKSLNSIIGFLHIKDIYKAALHISDNSSLADVYPMRQIIYVKHTEKEDEVLKHMQQNRVHMAVVINEKKRMVGIVTLEDIIESIVGEVEDEFDKLEYSNN
jgi:putative hemolysin